MTAAVADAVRRYLDRTRDAYEPGDPVYYARVALNEALEAFLEDNYGIGAVAVVADESTIREFRGRNAMVSGLGVVDHAETRALLKYMSGSDADAVYPRELNAYTRRVPTGLSVYGTLEPCPMCTVTLTNVGAVRSVSTVLDGRLIRKNGVLISDGGASSIGRKAKLQPQVWQGIQERQGLAFSLLETADTELTSLSADLFLKTREQIDRRLAQKKAGVHAKALILSCTARRPYQ